MRAHPGRKGHPQQLREQAAAMRREGRSRAGIARELDVGAATVGRWFREDGVPAPRTEPQGPYDAQLEAVRERWAAQQSAQDEHRDAVGPLSGRELLLLGSAIYWAEGAKAKPWRRLHRLTFINSDPSMIMLFLAYLALVGVAREDVRCRLQIHRDADADAAVAFWTAWVGEDLAWRPTTLKRHNPKPSRHNRGESYRGCLTIEVRGSAAAYRRVAGTWEGVAAAVRKHQSPVV